MIRRRHDMTTGDGWDEELGTIGMEMERGMDASRRISRCDVMACLMDVHDGRLRWSTERMINTDGQRCSALRGRRDQSQDVLMAGDQPLADLLGLMAGEKLI